MAEGFLGRWSQRKIAVKSGKPVEDIAPTPSTPSTPVAASAQAMPPVPAGGIWGQPNFQAYGAPTPAASSDLEGASSAAGPDTANEAAPQAAPTIQDAQTLTPASDFKPYMSAQVDPDVRNAAMKKLFADPHFNVMDGLDIYIDDYTQPDPLPVSMMRQMASAHFLGLFDEEKKEPPSHNLRAADGLEASDTQAVIPSPQPFNSHDPCSPTTATDVAASTPVWPPATDGGRQAQDDQL